MTMPPFHLAFPVDDIAEARHFYGEVMGCREGRSDTDWVDFDFYGHQLVAHCVKQAGGDPDAGANPVDGHQVPVPHFGVVLSMTEWQALADRLEGKVDFAIPPHIRFKGEPGEQATMFFRDPSGNALEIKAFADPSRLFAT
ncbi:VOC family protein [Pseudoblastomonas halimionae]|uniref:Glyoxalase n=1 Tax=Alteriqipengyuania halimionae TaxID=1926630 RepID=A0A6I4U2T5_9SPHN|nr:VOC family protein [Alteriqipengyuania halimionae]MXP10238.1 glyoxalase [Alteriqipengyuania halimionae]